MSPRRREQRGRKGRNRIWMMTENMTVLLLAIRTSGGGTLFHWWKSQFDLEHSESSCHWYIHRYLNRSRIWLWGCKLGIAHSSGNNGSYGRSSVTKQQGMERVTFFRQVSKMLEDDKWVWTKNMCVLLRHTDPDSKPRDQGCLGGSVR